MLVEKRSSLLLLLLLLAIPAAGQNFFINATVLETISAEITDFSVVTGNIVDFLFTIKNTGNINISALSEITVYDSNNNTVVKLYGDSVNISVGSLKDLKLSWNTSKTGNFTAKLVVFYDNKSVTASKTFVLLPDRNPPRIEITFPFNGTTIGILNNAITGSVSDESNINVYLYLNNQLLESWTSPGKFSKKVDYIAGKWNNINLTAIDIYGNTNSTEVMVNVLPSSIIVNTTTVPNQTIEVNASETRNATNTVIELNATVSANVIIRINASTNASALNAVPATTAFGLAQNQRSLDKYIQVNMTGIDTANLSYVTLAMFYTIADLDRNGDGDADDPGDLNERTLKMYWYNLNTSLWMLLGPNGKPDYTSLGGPKILDSERNTTAKYLKVTLNHFSTFALVAEVVTALPTETPVATGDGGGSGAGVTSREPLTNIEKREIREGYLRKDVPTSYKFVSPEIPVDEIVITANLNAGTISVQVELLKDTSKLVTTPAPGIIYKNINIWVGIAGFATPKNIKEAIIKFRVENSWMGANNVQAGDISTLRWDTGWSKIETKEIKKDAKFTYFEAKTSAFSPFAIVAKVPEIVPTITPTATPAVTVMPPVMPGILAWGYALAIVIIMLAVYFFMIKKRRKEVE